MYLTMIEHEGSEWTVHLTVIPNGSQPAALELTGKALDGLYEQGNQLSEALLREQLALAFAEERIAEPTGVGIPAQHQREHGL